MGRGFGIVFLADAASRSNLDVAVTTKCFNRNSGQNFFIVSRNGVVRKCEKAGKAQKSGYDSRSCRSGTCHDVAGLSPPILRPLHVTLGLTKTVVGR